MRVAIYATRDATPVEDILSQYDVERDSVNPDVVITYGGDGSLILAERQYPGVLKVPVKGGSANNITSISLATFRQQLPALLAGNIEVTELPKLIATAGEQYRYALNEIHMHPRLPITAPRFSLTAGERQHDHLIADGMVISTPFGSTAYYYSVGGTPFDNGIGIAINNAHNARVAPFVVSSDTVVTVTVIRERPLVFADNNEYYMQLQPGDTCTIQLGDAVARIAQFDEIR